MSKIYRKVVSHQAEKFLHKQSSQMQKRIVASIRGLPKDGDIKKLKGSIFYRIRVGNIRVVFEIDHLEKIISIQTIDNRGDIY